MVIPRYQRPERGITAGNRAITAYAEASRVKKPLPLPALPVTPHPLWGMASALPGDADAAANFGRTQPAGRTAAAGKDPAGAEPPAPFPRRSSSYRGQVGLWRSRATHPRGCNHKCGEMLRGFARFQGSLASTRGESGPEIAIGTGSRAPLRVGPPQARAPSR